jgi:cytochrome P450
MPKWNWFTGHLLVLGKYLDPLPSNAFVQLAMQDLALEFSETEVFLMDVWPIYPAFWVVYDPQASVQVSTKLNLPKIPLHLKFMYPIVGGPNLHSMTGSEWKAWRTIFNPGFSASSMADLMPAVIDSVQVFCDILREHVGSGIIKLDELSTRLTMEVILKVTL